LLLRHLFMTRTCKSLIGPFTVQRPPLSLYRVQTYFTEVWVNRDESSLDSEIFSDLPSYLRARVAQYITTDLVLQVRHYLYEVTD
jgi:hypothetical protein